MATEEQLREYLKRVTVDLSEARRRLAELADSPPEPVAIIGMACRYPGGETVEDFWDLLREGRSSVTEVPAARWNADDYYDPERRSAGAVYTRHGAFLSDIAGWDAEFFGVPPAEALRMDPNQRLLMELLWEGLENAGISPARAAGTRTAVFAGLMDSLQYGRLEADRQGTGVTADPYFGQGISTSVVAGRLAYHYGLRGAAVTLDTACSSSLVGLHLAAQALRGGECDMAVAAGAYLIMQPDTYVQGCVTSMLTPQGQCRTFDQGADGYVMGEGGGLVVLERLSSALRNGRRIRAVLRGSAVNSDGRSNGLTAPSRGAQAEVIRQALAMARAEPGDVDYLEAHGSATALGDAIELSALHDVFGGRDGQRPLHVGAVKTNIGHTQSAAGMAGLIKTVLLLEHGEVPVTLNLSEPTGALPADGTIRPVTEPVRLDSAGRRPVAGVSSFGWSGTNAHLVVEAPPPAPSGPPEAGERPTACTLPVSAASPAALGQQSARLADWLAAHQELRLADVAHTLTFGRDELDYRCAVTAAGRDDAVRQLRAAAGAAGAASRARRAGTRPRVVFLLPGIGDQYPGMGRQLYHGEPVYAEAVDRCLRVLGERCGVDLRPLFFPDDVPGSDVQDNEGQAGQDAFARAVRPHPAGTDLAGTGPSSGAGDDRAWQAELAHPFQFTVEYALASLLASWGVTPDLLVGYSLGEYVAACLAGVFTLEDALHVVTERARLIASVPAGRMLAVAAGEEAVLTAIAESGQEADIAALNGPAMTVLSGTPEQVAAVAARLTARAIAVRPLRTAQAFHSRLLAPVRERLAELIESVPRKAPAIPVVSNHTSAPLTAEEAASGRYWAGHLVSPVRFWQGIGHCLADGADAFVELGAGQTLGSVVRQSLSTPGVRETAHRDAARVTVLGTLPSVWGDRRAAGERDALLTACSRLWEAGVAVDWPAAERPAGRIVTLPGYPFQRTRFWPEDHHPSSERSPVSPDRPAAATTSGPAEPADLCYAATWRRDLTSRPGDVAGRLDVTSRPGDPASRPGEAASSRRDVASVHPLPAAPSGPLIIFADADGIGSALADDADAAGAPVLEVIAGPPGTRPAREGRRIIIDPADPSAYREVFAEMPPASQTPGRTNSQAPGQASGHAPGDPPDYGPDGEAAAPPTLQVVHLWSQLGGAQHPQATAAELRAALHNGFGSLLLTAQALGELAPAPRVRLLTVTRGATEILGGDLTAPAQAAVHGLARVARHELPGLDWSGVDIDPATPSTAPLAAGAPVPPDGTSAAGRELAGAAPAGTAPAGTAPGDDARPGAPGPDGSGRAANRGLTSTAPVSTAPAADVALAARELAWELRQPPGEYPAVAGWRRGRRWEQDWTEVAPPADQDPPWRADGVYLITGGTRGLGLALARHLVRSGVRRLALVSRTKLREAASAPPSHQDEHSHQDERAGQDERAERAARSLADIAELEAAGAEVLLLAADAGDPDELRSVLRACREHFGALHGVVHAAGLPAGGMIARRGLDDAMTVLAPKVLAMEPLAELTGPQTPEALRLELLVLYSSAITAFGGIGEGDYCAANAVLDAYGAALAATAPSTRVLTVAWGPWQHDDWQAAALSGAGPVGDGLAGRVRAHRLKYGFGDEQGCAFLDRLIAAGQGSLLAVRQPMLESLREWSAILDISDLVNAVSARPVTERFPRPGLRTEFVPPRTEPEKLIAEIWGAFLGIDQVGVHDPFFELGGNSLVGLAVVRAAEKELGVTIPPATLFANPTVAEFATAVERPDATAEAALDLLNTSADRGRRRRGTRTGKRR